jgi:hypothetical protein
MIWQTSTSSSPFLLWSFDLNAEPLMDVNAIMNVLPHRITLHILENRIENAPTILSVYWWYTCESQSPKVTGVWIFGWSFKELIWNLLEYTLMILEAWINIFKLLNVLGDVLSWETKIQEEKAYQKEIKVDFGLLLEMEFPITYFMP